MLHIALVLSKAFVFPSIETPNCFQLPPVYNIPLNIVEKAMLISIVIVRWIFWVRKIWSYFSERGDELGWLGAASVLVCCSCGGLAMFEHRSDVVRFSWNIIRVSRFVSELSEKEFFPLLMWLMCATIVKKRLLSSKANSHHGLKENLSQSNPIVDENRGRHEFTCLRTDLIGLKSPRHRENEKRERY